MMLVDKIGQHLLTPHFWYHILSQFLLLVGELIPLAHPWIYLSMF